MGGTVVRLVDVTLHFVVYVWLIGCSPIIYCWYIFEKANEQCERLFFVVFCFRLIIHNFSKNVFSSLLLFLSGKNLVLFFMWKSSVSFFYF